MINEYVCAKCGHEQDSMNRCDRCNSSRVVLISVAKEIAGENWRDCFDPSKNCFDPSKKES
jgi:DNA-directed RNA polymerase subunit RPC12/RpoP